MTFEFATAQRILFGPGRIAEAPGLLAALGHRPLLVCGARPDRVPAALRALAVETCPVSGEPTFDAVRAALQAARAADVDVLVAVGGGSVIDFAKAVAMLLANGGDPLDYAEVIGAGRPITAPSLPLVAVPTTAGAGSEATRNAVLREPGRGLKVSLRSPLMLPTVALVDPELTRDLPPALTAATGMDALAQLIEPFLCNRAQPLTDALCRDGLPRVARALPRAFACGTDAAARSDLALGALLGGMALANAGLGAVHGFAGPIGGRFDAPHGAVCAALLAPVTAANVSALRSRAPGSAALDRYAEVAQWLTGRPDATVDDLPPHLAERVAALGIRGLSVHGVTDREFPELIRQARSASSMKANPVELTESELGAVLSAAL